MSETRAQYEATNPQTVRCVLCNHVWSGFYLPQPIDTVVRILKNLTCPKCGAGSQRIVMAQ